jgi:cardiolipin hydrolase
MKNEIAKLLEEMERSIEDQYLSRQERKDLKALLKELNFDDANNSWLLSKFRDLALEASADTESQHLLNWFYEGAKLVLGAKGESSETKGRAYFSPGEACRDAILYQLANAKTSVDICVFTISDDIISEAILAAHQRGLRVRIITDNDKAFDMGSDVDYLHEKGIPLRTDHTKVHMHHKFALFDSAILITGSYNWTRSAASSNYENIVVLEDADLIRSFKNEFGRLWTSLA